MTNIIQVVWEWSGFTGAPGYTNLFFDAAGGTQTDALAAVTKSQIFFSGLTPNLPDDVHIAPQTDVRVINDIDGKLVDIFTVIGVAGVQGGQPGNYAAPVGAIVFWPTTTVHGGRRMTGRTFIVPASAAAFQDDGTLNTAAGTTINQAAEDMRTASGPAFGVWGRPKFSKPATVPPTVVENGKWGPATSSRVPDKCVVLTSRRD
jgi:hypothetical protein